MATQILQNFVSEDASFKQILVDVSTRSLGFTAKVKRILMILLKLMKKVIGMVLSLETWK